MNDARWLGQWVAQQVKAPPADAEMEALAKQAERAAARDGFSVDDALREAGCDTFRAFVLEIPEEGHGTSIGSTTSSNSRENTGSGAPTKLS